MSLRFPSAVVCLVALPFGLAHAAEAPTAAFLTPANGNPRMIWITSADEQAIHYKESPQATASAQIAKGEVKALQVFATQAMADARALFECRKYDAARTKFQTVREQFKDLAGIDGNPSAEATFMELECLRKSGDLEGLAAAFTSLDRRGINRESQRRQLDLYGLWDAVRLKDWPRVESTAREHCNNPTLLGCQRAQAAYCLGLALDAQGKTGAAIDAYQAALTTDGGTSVEIARDAALKALRLYRKDPEVIAAMKGGNEGAGRLRLLEAAGLASLFGTLPGLEEALPGDLAEFLKFRPETAAKEKP
ncbi:hypothetical protein [Haloferula sp. BvORR071]|uniref:hypothetical protein n=1 Tax=Haloferula sp. BvORR071 TaxID=1396141 RepID=UPI00055790F1|nr:hypothetical protein [Haloferula sp. BvORR071]